MDRYAEKFPEHTAYQFAGNRPISAIDVNGGSIYILMHVVGFYDDPSGDLMFEAAAHTRAREIKKSPNFDPTRDKVVVISVSNLDDIKTYVDDIYHKNCDYGDVVEVGIWSHAGLDGPVAPLASENDPLEDFPKQMTLDGWQKIDFHWSDSENNRCVFYGCKTAKNPNWIGDNSFAHNISELTDFKDVNVLGQKVSSYPSLYTDYRKTSDKIEWGEYDKTDNIYMVGSEGGLNDFLFSTKAYKFSIYKNGEKTGSTYQEGKKSEDDQN